MFVVTVATVTMVTVMRRPRVFVIIVPTPVVCATVMSVSVKVCMVTGGVGPMRVSLKAVGAGMGHLGRHCVVAGQGGGGGGQGVTLCRRGRLVHGRRVCRSPVRF